jgi:membrane fusion protein (multidrug efflux system)
MMKKLTSISIVAGLFLFSMIACKGKDSSELEKNNKNGQNIYQVQAVKPEMKKVNHFISATGTANPDREVEIRTTVSGVIDKIYVEEGDYVNAGQSLADIDLKKFQLVVEQSRAALSQAKAAYENANLELERKKTLLDKKAISQGMFDGIKTQYEAMKAAYEMAQVGIKNSDMIYNDARLKTPISGYIKKREKEVGEYVDAMMDNLLFVVIKTDPIRLRFSLPEKYVGMVKKGYKFSTTFNYLPEKEFEGTVTIIPPAVDQATRTVMIEGQIRNSNSLIKAGAFAEIKLNLDGNQKSLTVPSNAVLSEQGEKYVYRIIDGKAVRTKIIIGVENGEYIEILSGLSLDDQIVTEGKSGLYDGASVEMKQAK